VVGMTGDGRVIGAAFAAPKATTTASSPSAAP